MVPKLSLAILALLYLPFSAFSLGLPARSLTETIVSASSTFTSTSALTFTSEVISTSTLASTPKSILTSTLASTATAISAATSAGTSTAKATAIATSSATASTTSSFYQSVPSNLGKLQMDGHDTLFPYATETTTMPMPNLDTPLPEYSPRLRSGQNLMFQTAAVIRPTDPFRPVATSPAPSQIPNKSNHPVARLNIKDQSSPLQTNKFYANLFLGDQSNASFTFPYTLAWSKGGGYASSWGMAVTQSDYNQKIYGPTQDNLPGHPVRFFINPVWIQDMIISAKELGSTTFLSTDTLAAFSANAVLSASATERECGNITFPLVQGMAFVTAIYNNMTPLIQSGSGISSIITGRQSSDGIFKYTVRTNDGHSWLLYASPTNKQNPKLLLGSNAAITGSPGFNGIIQIAKLSTGASTQSLYDDSAGVYATSATLTGSVAGANGSYSLQWNKAGNTTKTLLMWALPHHIQSFSSASASGVKSLSLPTTTKGNATAVVADTWTMVENNLPTSLGFAPWSPSTLQSNVNLSPSAAKAITAAAISELSQNIAAQTNLNSMYYSGKAFAKFAAILYVAKDMLQNNTLTTQGLSRLEDAFALFTTNQQQFPLVYDSSWGGVVSSAGYTSGNLLADFGNTAYNDHHFHYGYFIYTAAVIGYLDPAWLTKNKDWVNALVRDVANPSSLDKIYPVFRMFDWYHGHSWAHGLFASGDGKDEESSSEDTNFAYALKLWGKVTGDTSMEARGNLMLSVLARSLNNYFLYQDDNGVMPPQFIGNKVSGIMFENKIDHTTYFGTNLEYIQGIHMLPILPHSALIRTPTFVRQEWEAFFAEGAVDPANQVAGGWRGILYANLALYDARSSFAFFSQSNFNPAWLDSGASQTWYLAYAAGRGGG